MSVNELPQESPPVDVDMRNIRTPDELAELESEGVPGAGYQLFPPPRERTFLPWISLAGLAALAAGLGLFGRSRRAQARKMQEQSQ